MNYYNVLGAINALRPLLTGSNFNIDVSSLEDMDEEVSEIELSVVDGRQQVHFNIINDLFHKVSLLLGYDVTYTKLKINNERVNIDFDENTITNLFKASNILNILIRSDVRVYVSENLDIRIGARSTVIQSDVFKCILNHAGYLALMEAETKTATLILDMLYGKGKYKISMADLKCLNEVEYSMDYLCDTLELLNPIKFTGSIKDEK